MKTYIAIFETSDDWRPTNTIKDSCIATGIVKGIELNKIQAKRLLEVDPNKLAKFLDDEDNNRKD